jgi:adenylate cyclase
MQLAFRKRAGDSAAGEIADAMAREEVAGLATMFWGRVAALTLLALWVLLTLPFARSQIYLLAIILFALLGAPSYLLARRGVQSTLATAFFLLLDASILTYILIVPPPFLAEQWTPQLNYRLPNFLYFGVFLASMALSYSPTLVIWAGVASIVAWSTGFLWVATLPDTIRTTSRSQLDSGLSPEAIIGNFLNPSSVSLTSWYNQLVFLTLVTGILALAVWRSRRLVYRRAAAEAERSALSRYFSPNLVRELSTRSPELARPAVQPVAVLFADMVGFTAISERLPPDALVALLREFHGRLVQVAFAHGGTIDKYIGDAIMVHFGTPRSQRNDPIQALACAGAMLDEIRGWSAERVRRGDVPIEIGVGVHYGEVLVGNIGDARRLEYTVLGDTVNVASRLERMTREAGVPLIVSDDLVTAVRGCGEDPCVIVKDLTRDTERTVRGRQQPIAIWCVTARLATDR